MLELAEEAFNQVALAIDAEADRTLDDALSGGRNMSFGAAGPDHEQESVGVVAAIGYDIAALEPFQQKRCSTQIVSLTRG